MSRTSKYLYYCNGTSLKCIPLYNNKDKFNCLSGYVNSIGVKEGSTSYYIPVSSSTSDFGQLRCYEKVNKCNVIKLNNNYRYLPSNSGYIMYKEYYPKTCTDKLWIIDTTSVANKLSPDKINVEKCGDQMCMYFNCTLEAKVKIGSTDCTKSYNLPMTGIIVDGNCQAIYSTHTDKNFKLPYIGNVSFSYADNGSHGSVGFTNPYRCNMGGGVIVTCGPKIKGYAYAKGSYAGAQNYPTTKSHLKAYCYYDYRIYDYIEY